jgi:chemotaxis protein MotA
MDISTILGIIIGFGLVGTAMSLGGGFFWFVNIPSVMIVMGGTLGAILINYPMADVVGIIKVAMNVLFQKEQKTEEVIALFVDLAKVAQREGLLALEHRMENISDPFFSKGITLVVDGTEPGTLSKILYTELDYIKERHDTGAEMFTTMGNFAPAMGMVGTWMTRATSDRPWP